MTSAYVGYTVVEDGESRSRLEAVHAELARLNSRAQETSVLERRLADLQEARPNAPYRAADVAELRRELDEARAARLDRKKLRIEEAKLMREMEADRRALQAKGIRRISLPVLENAEIAAPCNVSWADMDGDTDVRFCGSCMKQVFNLSMMSREEAEAVLGVRAGKGICVRLFRRDDGTVLTQDCSVGARRQRFWRRSKSIAAGGLILAAIGMAALKALGPKVQQAGSMGAVTSLPPG